MHSSTGATLSTGWPVSSVSPVRMALRRRISTGVEPAGLGESVHLRLVGEAGLDRTEPAHRTARQVIGSTAYPSTVPLGQAYGPCAIVIALTSTADEVEA